MKERNTGSGALYIARSHALAAKVIQKYNVSPAQPVKNNSIKSNDPVNNEISEKSFQILSSPRSVTSAPKIMIKASISSNDVLGGCKKLFTSPVSLGNDVEELVAKKQPPLLYVGIILKRPEGCNPSTPFSWGFSMIKEKLCVHVVGINSTGQRPATKFCRVTNQIPSPSIMYNSSALQRNAEEYEASFMRCFPPSWKESFCSAPSLSARCLQLGDAIVSINGVSVSTLESTAKVASFIRQCCQETLIIVALRHDVVWRAGWKEITTKLKLFSPITQARSADSKHQQQKLQQKMKDNIAAEQKRRVAKAIKEAWVRVQNQRDSHQVKRKIDVQMPSSSKRYKFDSLMLHTLYNSADTRQLTNDAFLDRRGYPILYSDNDDFDPDDGRRFRLFTTRDVKKSFDDWLIQRKIVWRKSRKMLCRADSATAEQENEIISVPHNFWLANGYESFDTWLVGSKSKWRRSYSWHKDRRIKLQTETEKEVHFPIVGPITLHDARKVVLRELNDWLGVRKQQWRIIRRRRHLQRRGSIVNYVSDASSHKGDIAAENNCCLNHVKSRRSGPRSNKVSACDTMIIDEMLEDQQREERQQEIDLPPLDISWIFDADMSAPDDVIVLLMRFLNPCDHGNLLCLSWGSNYSFKKRDSVWQSLCPKRWILPRRPRKSWCVMYITKIRGEEEASRKQSDDLLTRADAVIDKGDQLNKLKSIVLKAERDFSFDVNYTSGTVLERNSLLNIAVINRRKNIVKWLIEEKHSDIETCDRGNFTPLLNAAWNGDKYLVRYLLLKGSDRKKIGTFHSSRGMASNHFQGMNAEGWARERGHIEVADLIRIGV